jgi:hypothetical protein
MGHGVLAMRAGVLSIRSIAVLQCLQAVSGCGRRERIVGDGDLVRDGKVFDGRIREMI